MSFVYAHPFLTWLIIVFGVGYAIKGIREEIDDAVARRDAYRDDRWDY